MCGLGIRRQGDARRIWTVVALSLSDGMATDPDLHQRHRSKPARSRFLMASGAAKGRELLLESLLELSMTAGSKHIKCRPLEWSQGGLSKYHKKSNEVSKLP